MSRVVCWVLLLGLLVGLGLGTAQAQEGEVLVCLDPGHGGSDPGAVHQFADGMILKEADINLDEALAVKALLEHTPGRQVAVMLTRDDDTAMTVRERYPMANNAHATLLVSIHTNSIDAQRAGGADGTCTLTIKPQDQLFARIMQSNLYYALRPGAPDGSVFFDRGVLPFRSRILSSTDMPSVIVEPVFLSHPGEAARLVSPVQRDAQGNVLVNTLRGQIARAVYQGILSYLDYEQSPLPDSPMLSPAPTALPIPTRGGEIGGAPRDPSLR
jgi:N-acetylmuramoyl-L-alanine amidase